MAVKNWLHEANITLPDLTLEKVLLGHSGSNIENFLFLLYQCVLFSAKTRGQPPNINHYQSKVIECEKLEYIIAEKNSHLLNTHLKKYGKIRHKLY